MDPKATLDAAWQSVRGGHLDDAEESLECYADWRHRGGFEPLWGRWSGDAFFLMVTEAIRDAGGIYLGRLLP